VGPHRFNTSTPKQVQALSVWPVGKEDREPNGGVVEGEGAPRVSDPPLFTTTIRYDRARGSLDRARYLHRRHLHRRCRPVTRTGAFGMTVPQQPAAAAWAGRLHPFPAAAGTLVRPTAPESPAPIVDWT